MIRATEKKVSNDQAATLVQLVERTLRAGAADAYAVRIRLDAPKVPAPVVERSKVCPPEPGRRNLATATAIVSASEVGRIQSAVAQAAAARARQRFHVLVSPTGRAMEVKIIDGGGDQAGADANTRSLRARTHTPATVDGIKVAAWLELDGNG